MESPTSTASSKRRTQSSSGELQATGSRMLKKDRYRIVVMGAACVGKTCIISRLLYESFLSEYKATVEELHCGHYELNGVPLALDILDTSGAYEFPAMRRLSISTGDAFILVYSFDDPASFEQVKHLRQLIIDEKHEELTPIVIVCNKTDLPSPDIDDRRRLEVQTTAEATANIDWGNGFVEVSAKDDVNIAGIFRELLAQADLNLLESVELSGDGSSQKSHRSGSCGKNSGKNDGRILEQSVQMVRRTSSKRQETKRTSCRVS